MQAVETALADLHEQQLAYAPERPATPIADNTEPAPQPVAEPQAIAPNPTTSVPTVALRRGDTVAFATPSPPPVSPEEAPDDAPFTEEATRFSLAAFDFEDIFGRRLPIWAGGVALAVAGVFLVRYSIERGLITPEIRVVMAFLFGMLLLGGAELAFRFKDRVRDARVSQALAGAGLATLYAGFYLAGSEYGLIGQTFAFLGLAAVTAAAIALSYRFGLPSAVLGLLGGFAAPALVGGDEANVPLLALYLGLVTAGLTVTGQRQSRPWLGVAALVGGLGWGALLLLAGDPGAAEILALGLYFVVLGAVLPTLAGAARFKRAVQLGSALVASVQLALLVDQGGYSPLAWGMYLLMGGTLAWFGWKRPELREANAAAAVVGVLLLAQWKAPDPWLFGAAGIALTGVFAAVPLVLLARSNQRAVDLAQIALVPPALALIGYATFVEPERDRFEGGLALATALLAMVPLAGAWLARSLDQRWLAGLAGSAAALAFAALLMVTPGWSAPLAAAAVVATLVWLAHREGGAAPLANLLAAGAIITLLAGFATPDFAGEAGRLGGLASDASVIRALLRWLAMALPFAALAWVERRGAVRAAAECLAAAVSYGVAAQVLPPECLAWVAALCAIALGWRVANRLPAVVTLLVIAGFWALQPMGKWAAAGLLSLAADPVFVGDIPSWRDTLTHLLPVAAGIAFARLPSPMEGLPSERLRWAALPVTLIVVHVLYKQIFAIETVSGFIDYGIAERTLWQALLAGSAWLVATRFAHHGLSRIAAIALAGAALLHAIVYSWLLHDPLWVRQAVGPTPLANWMLASAAVSIGAAWLLRQWLPDRARPVIDGTAMALAALAALGLLRQAFGGAIPVDTPLSQTEDLLRSLLGIVLALVFLWIGSIREERSWRVGSLVLILLAVAKVFLLDAAGLEGLLRVASFMALGFSLIGIGWVYSRQLLTRPAPTG